MADHATKQDLQELGEQIADRMAAMEERLIERMRDMQTELLRGFEAHSTGMNIRMRKLEADQSNLDAAASGRIGSGTTPA
jgi:hypothetical protein